MKRLMLVLMAVSTFSVAVPSAACADDDRAPNTFTVWQLPSQTPAQNMSYVIRTVHGKLIVIDGGRAGDAAYLAEFLKKKGNRVAAWFVTHAHDDHFMALAALLKDPQGLTIKRIYASLPDTAWMGQYGDAGEKACLAQFNAALQQAKYTITELTLGAKLYFDGIRVQVLGVKNPEITRNPVNNSSVVLRMSDAQKSVLFLGDLGFEGGEKLPRGPYAKRLSCDYVQMAHHGQNGVGEAVYQRIRPHYCLWPTPLWLWDCDSGGGKGSGRWRTLEVRAWMRKMPVMKHYVSYEGLCEIK